MGCARRPRLTSNVWPLVEYQVTATEWRALVPVAPSDVSRFEGSFSGEALIIGGVGLLAGALIRVAVSNLRHHRRP